MPVTIRILGPADGVILQRVAPGAFDNPVDARWSAEFLADPRHHLAVATDDTGKVIAMASGLHYVHPDKPPEFWVNEVGVAPTHQARGIGRRVLSALLAHARSLGCREAWVLTSHDNQGRSKITPPRAWPGPARTDPPTQAEMTWTPLPSQPAQAGFVNRQLP